MAIDPVQLKAASDRAELYVRVLFPEFQRCLISPLKRPDSNFFAL